MPSEAHNAALQAITDDFTASRTTFVALRTNEAVANQIDDWELRSFALSPGGRFVQTTVNLTPDQSFSNTTTLASYINANEAQILGHAHVVPEQFNSAPFLGGRASNPFTIDPVAQRIGMFWKAPGINNNDARHLFSLNTCSGCHGNETGTIFTHFSNRSPGGSSSLSGYLNGVTVTDPVSGVARTFNEGNRRANELRRFFCPPSSGTDSFSIGEGAQRAF
ncbi:MAG: hypothetical protein QOI66_1794 [Myxococcales bacterium]|nr:hypothetical protein [Myxococcales bacterium]